MKDFLEAIFCMDYSEYNLSESNFRKDVYGKKAFGQLLILIANFLFHFALKTISLLFICVLSIGIGIIAILSTIVNGISDFWNMLKSYFFVMRILAKRIFSYDKNQSDSGDGTV